MSVGCPFFVFRAERRVEHRGDPAPGARIAHHAWTSDVSSIIGHLFWPAPKDHHVAQGVRVERFARIEDGYQAHVFEFAGDGALDAADVARAGELADDVVRERAALAQGMAVKNVGSARPTGSVEPS